MNYELAKQLKDAGYEFVPIDPSLEIRTGKKQVYTAFRIAGQDYYEPTLSELIEACGKPFLILQQNLVQSDDKKWEAGSYWRTKTIQVFGSTPEKAVAKLWLKLNKKQ